MIPKVSILFPVYNTAAYLREAVDSMLAQTFRDFELIVLDDCSPDNAADLLDTYTDPRIVRYRGEKNVGLANVLNVGMDMARGEYIARMDSDDVSLPTRLQVQVDYLDSHPDIDLCSCAMELFGAKSDVWVRDAEPEAVKFRALFYSPILHASSMWRRERFADLRFRQETVPAEDYDLWTRALAEGLRLVNMPDVLYRYRIFPGQATSQNEKVAIKTTMVRTNYIRHVFPQADNSLIADISHLELLFATNVFELERVLGAMVKQNAISHYFDESFNVRCKRYYQAALYSQMLNNGIDFSKLLRLRLPQIYKLLRIRLF